MNTDKQSAIKTPLGRILSYLAGENAPAEILADIQEVDNLGTSKRFVPPTVEEVADHMRKKRILNPQENAEKFVAHYGSANWMRGKTKITNWKLAVATWKLPKQVI